METTAKQLVRKFLITFSILFVVGSVLFRIPIHAQNNCSSVILCATTGSIGGGALLVGASAAGTVTVTGAQVGMPCIAQPSDGTDMIAVGAIPVCIVTSANTVTVRVIAILALTPTAKTYVVRVLS
jgi:hypothetical protein